MDTMRIHQRERLSRLLFLQVFVKRWPRRLARARMEGCVECPEEICGIHLDINAPEKGCSPSSFGRIWAYSQTDAYGVELSYEAL